MIFQQSEHDEQCICRRSRTDLIVVVVVVVVASIAVDTLNVARMAAGSQRALKMLASWSPTSLAKLLMLMLLTFCWPITVTD